MANHQEEEEIYCTSEDSGCMIHGSFVDLHVGDEIVKAVPDTAAMSVWVSETWFTSRGYRVEKDQGVVVAANGSTMDVYGSGRLSFRFLGVLFKDVPVRVLSGMESDILIGLKVHEIVWYEAGLFRRTGKHKRTREET